MGKYARDVKSTINFLKHFSLNFPIFISCDQLIAFFFKKIFHIISDFYFGHIILLKSLKIIFAFPFCIKILFFTF